MILIALKLGWILISFCLVCHVSFKFLGGERGKSRFKGTRLSVRFSFLQHLTLHYNAHTSNSNKHQSYLSHKMKQFGELACSRRSRKTTCINILASESHGDGITYSKRIGKGNCHIELELGSLSSQTLMNAKVSK